MILNFPDINFRKSLSCLISTNGSTEFVRQFIFASIPCESRENKLHVKINKFTVQVVLLYHTEDQIRRVFVDN